MITVLKADQSVNDDLFDGKSLRQVLFVVQAEIQIWPKVLMKKSKYTMYQDDPTQRPAILATLAKLTIFPNFSDLSALN